MFPTPAQSELSRTHVSGPAPAPRGVGSALLAPSDGLAHLRYPKEGTKPEMEQFSTWLRLGGAQPIVNVRVEAFPFTGTLLMNPAPVGTWFRVDVFDATFNWEMDDTAAGPGPGTIADMIEYWGSVPEMAIDLTFGSCVDSAPSYLDFISTIHGDVGRIVDFEPSSPPPPSLPVVPPPATSPPPPPAPMPVVAVQVSLKLTKSRIPRSKRFIAKGATLPVHGKAKVTLWGRRGGKASKLGSAFTSSDGTYRLTSSRMKKTGKYKVWVAVEAAPGFSAAMSAMKSLKVT